MKRFTILLTTLIGVLAFSAVFQAWSDARAEGKKASVPVQVYDATGAMLEAVNASSSESRVAPVYDATGAMLDAINPNENVTTLPAYDATGAMLDAINPDKKVITDPAYDATGAMLDAINP
jgi:hypothetical protein